MAAGRSRSALAASIRGSDGRVEEREGGGGEGGREEGGGSKDGLERSFFRERAAAGSRRTALTPTPFCSAHRYQKLWKSYVKLRHLLANSPKVKQLDKQKLMQREVGVGAPPSF